MPRNNDSYYRQLELITGMSSQPDYAGQLQRQLQQLQSQQGAASTGARGGGGAGGSDFQRFVNALVGQESGGNYGAVNRSSGAAGRYQIMPANISSWSREALGRTVSLNEFMRNPKIQDAIAQYKLRQYVNRYGFQGAAAAWYGGPGVAKNWSSRTNRQGAYPSIANYVAQVMRRMGR